MEYNVEVTRIDENGKMTMSVERDNIYAWSELFIKKEDDIKTGDRLKIIVNKT